MANLSTTLDQILDEQVQSGRFSSKEEVTQELLQLLIERDIDKNIARGMEQIEAGQGIEMNETYKSSLQNRILNRLSLKQR